jgi:Integrase core domain
MDINAAYREVGTYRGAADMCGTTAKTVKRVVTAAGHETGPVRHNYDSVRDIVVERVAKTKGRISAKRLLPVACAAGYTGSPRNFRRLVADAKAAWRADHHRGRRPGVWTPGDMLVIDWGEIGALSVFCAVLAWSRWRFVFFADNQRAETTLAALAACFEQLGGVPKTVLSDRMGCIKGATVAGVVVPTADYVRFANSSSVRRRHPARSKRPSTTSCAVSSSRGRACSALANTSPDAVGAVSAPSAPFWRNVCSRRCRATRASKS